MAEAATRVTPNSWSDEMVVFGRYEKFDTQNKMPAGYLPLQEFQRSAWVAGATYYPDPDVAFKFDFVRERNKSGVVRARGESISEWAGGSDDAHLFRRVDGRAFVSGAGSVADAPQVIRVSAERFALHAL